MKFPKMKGHRVTRCINVGISFMKKSQLQFMSSEHVMETWQVSQVNNDYIPV